MDSNDPDMLTDLMMELSLEQVTKTISIFCSPYCHKELPRWYSLRGNFLSERDNLHSDWDIENHCAVGEREQNQNQSRLIAPHSSELGFNANHPHCACQWGLSCILTRCMNEWRMMALGFPTWLSRLFCFWTNLRPKSSLFLMEQYADNWSVQHKSSV